MAPVDDGATSQAAAAPIPVTISRLFIFPYPSERALTVRFWSGIPPDHRIPGNRSLPK
jgi:hypothetical protein